MIKQMLIAVVLILLLSGHSWDAEASRRSIRPDQTVDVQLTETKVREKRFVNPFTGLFSIWNALTHIYSLYVEQKNETYFAFEQTYDIIADGFNDTYMSTKRPTVHLLNVMKEILNDSMTYENICETWAELAQV